MTDETALNWLPDLLEFDWNQYQESLDRAYAAFQRDFSNTSRLPEFRGKRMALKRHPELDGKSATFWHIVTEGNVEEDRTPSRERIERIMWPKALLEEASQAAGRVYVWSNERQRATHSKSTRWVIALADFSYVVVLDERDDYVLLWTAYPVDQQHQRNKLMREFEAWSRAQKC